MIVVAYSGVHQAYQLAIAALSQGKLEAFLCSWLVSPGRWGARLERLLGKEALVSRRCPALHSAKVQEYPWPLLWRLLLGKWGVGSNGQRLLRAQERFDAWASRQIKRMPLATVVVGSDTCCKNLFRVARAMGKRTLLDRPGIDAKFLQVTCSHAADKLGIAPNKAILDEPAKLRARKATELELADHVLLCSEFQRKIMASLHPGHSEKFSVVPLWVDSDFWRPSRKVDSDHIRVMYAGGISLAKGVPFLLEAIRNLGNRVSLTLVGTLDSRISHLIPQGTNLLAPVNKARLRELYVAHDVFVLPSLGDSFGFVGLEAMSCGLPVIASDHCGLPLPDESWRVKAMDAEAIERRLCHYLDDKDCLRMDGELARRFAVEWSAERYRVNAYAVMSKLLSVSRSD